MRGLIQSAMNNGNSHNNHEFALPSSSTAMTGTYTHGIVQHIVHFGFSKQTLDVIVIVSLMTISNDKSIDDQEVR